MNYDVVNGAFELGGASLVTLSVRRLLLDRQVRGVSVWPVLFFAAWGYWNLLYYPSLDQWWSFWGGAALAAVNTVWLFLVWRLR